MTYQNLKTFVSFFVFLLFAFLFFNLRSLGASHCPSTDYDCQIAEIQKDIDALKPAQEKNQKELENLRKQLSDIKKRLLTISSELSQLANEIGEREVDLSYQETLLAERVRSYYIRFRQYSPLVTFLFAENAAHLTRELAIREQAASEDRRVIEELSRELVSLKHDKETLEKSKAGLVSLQAQVNEREKFLAVEVGKVESYISSLSAKQQELLAAKAGGFQTSVGDTPATLVPCSGPPGSANFCSPGFSPSFGAFSFGAPHRTGMSQYGAYGRAKLGQSAESILSAYYQGTELNKGYAIPDTIGVSGYGRIPFEDNYLLGIYEVPEVWGEQGGFEALKAQAVAARSYALAATGGGAGTICTTEACQVYKPQLKSGKWKEAVGATRGWVLTRGQAPATTYYASTSGGFTISQWGWSGIVDTVGGSVDSWPDQAYEKIAGSPWFYMGWYKNRAGASCGRSHPWLTGEEFADILNAWVVYKSGDAGRVSPLDTNCWPGNPYSREEMKSRAEALGGAYLSVSSVSVVYANNGVSQAVNLTTDRGAVSIVGSEFKTVFNLRAPGFIGIKSGLFNIVKL